MLDCSDMPVGSLKDSRWPIMQFTGLLDKTGKEIFEGDVVDRMGFRFQVWFRNQSWFPDNLDENTEIIGNIYSNPELLESNEKN